MFFFTKIMMEINESLKSIITKIYQPFVTACETANPFYCNIDSNGSKETT